MACLGDFIRVTPDTKLNRNKDDLGLPKYCFIAIIA